MPSPSTPGAGRTSRTSSSFPSAIPAARTYKIETNYRSVPEILHVANAAIEANEQQFPKELQAARETRSVKPALLELNDTNQQALFVTQRILELRDEGVELNEIAVLYRGAFPFDGTPTGD